MVRVHIEGEATVFSHPHGDAEEIDGSKELDLGPWDEIHLDGDGAVIEILD